MTWQILLFISVVSYSFCVLLQRVLLKNDKSNPIAYSIIFQLFTGICIGIYALFTRFSLPSNLFSLFPNLILTIILYCIGNIFLFKALKLNEASTFTILFSTRVFWIVLGSIIFLKEAFTLQHIFGTTLVIISIILVMGKKKLFTFSKGLIFALVASALYGLAFVNDAIILNVWSIPSYPFYAFVAPAFVLWMFNIKTTKDMDFIFNKGIFFKMVLLAFLYAVSALSTYLAYQIGKNVSQIGPINQTSSIITVFLGIFLLKETDNLFKKILGVIISFIGVLFLI